MDRKTRLNEKGLTLIELLAVIVILGIIAAIGTIAIMNVIQNMKDKAFVGNAYALKEAASFYIRQEIANDRPLPEKLTYKNLVEANFIDEFKDPDTGKYLNPSDDSFIVIEGGNAAAVCLKGTKRSLCSYKGSEGIPFSELSIEFITKNSS